MYDSDALNRRFAREGRLHFQALDEGLAVADITTDLCTARIALQGAQLLDWTPAGEKPLIWLSKEAVFRAGKSIRGGVPVCWPWFGAHETRADYPAHGYARTVPWDLIAVEDMPDDRIRLDFCLQTSEATRAWWPYNSPLELYITLGDSLELELVTQNADTQAISITEALHTYFAVGDVRQVRVQGLTGCDYLDKVDAFTRKTQQSEIRIAAEVDRVYLDTQAECVIEDAAWQRRIHINKRGSHSTVVWNPWIDKSLAMGDMGQAGYLDMLCVESGNAASNVVTIPPGGEHRLWVRYHIES